MARLRGAATKVEEPVAIPSQSTGTADPEPDSSIIRPTRRRAIAKYTIPDDSDDESEVTTKPAARPATKPVVKARNQIRLAPLQSHGSLSDLRIQDDTPEKTRRRSPVKSSAKFLLQKRVPEAVEEARAQPPSIPDVIIPKADEDDVHDHDANIDQELDVEESIWCGSDSSASDDEDDLPSPSTFFPARRKKTEQDQPDLARQLEALSIFEQDVPQLPVKRPKAGSMSQPVQRPGSSSDKENADAIIRFSPPRSKKPFVKGKMQRPSTPPLPPASPTKLKSPSKRLPRIPTPPGRPSLDEFWTAGAVNDWNDQYSPQKPLRSPRKLFEPAPNLFDDTPIASPAKLQSPSKRSKVEVQARKDWDLRKVTIAENFLHELDQTITQGKIAELAAATGGVQLVWSKTLNSTAGRANWRRETTKSHSRSDPSNIITVHKHFASIELAEKVLTYSEDCETKLLNVLAHEFCHLTNFMISGVKDQPHGASFKAWGRQCSEAFRDRHIEVTTKHSYEIEYKYIWRCADEECGMEFKRHSKSIDPKRHRCGQCKANLTQIKPVPRGGPKQGTSGTSTPQEGGEVKPVQVNGYAAYVKQHFAVLKKSMPGASHKEVMEALGKKYRAEKAGKAEASAASVAEKLAEVKLSVEEIVDID
ncbi:putative sprT-like, zinc ribbon domain-containing protein [Septoria linicola]|nr:putative sprT-like, zinc ribbon domain-containing protein [Septoria linicola]